MRFPVNISVKYIKLKSERHNVLKSSESWYRKSKWAGILKIRFSVTSSFRPQGSQTSGSTYPSPRDAIENDSPNDHNVKKTLPEQLDKRLHEKEAGEAKDLSHLQDEDHEIEDLISKSKSRLLFNEQGGLTVRALYFEFPMGEKAFIYR